MLPACKAQAPAKLLHVTSLAILTYSLLKSLQCIDLMQKLYATYSQGSYSMILRSLECIMPDVMHTKIWHGHDKAFFVHRIIFTVASMSPTMR